MRLVFAGNCQWLAPPEPDGVGGSSNCSQSSARDPYPCNNTTVGGPDPPRSIITTGALCSQSHHDATAMNTMRSRNRNARLATTEIMLCQCNAHELCSPSRS